MAYPEVKVQKLKFLINMKQYEPGTRRCTIRDMQVLAGTVQDASITNPSLKPELGILYAFVASCEDGNNNACPRGQPEEQQRL